MPDKYRITATVRSTGAEKEKIREEASLEVYRQLVSYISSRSGKGGTS